MFADRILKELISEQQLLKETNLELKKKESLNKLLFLSLNQTNHHLQSLFSHLIQRQNRLLNYFIEENNRQVQRQTLVNLLQQVLSNENLLMNKLKRIHLKLTVNKKKYQRKPSFQGQTQLSTTDDSILTVYWHANKSLRSIPISKSSSDTCLRTYSNKISYWNFPKLERIKRNHFVK